MHLIGVEICGFKSFGERIYIDFNRGITSIVGPNGSGKSNIMDAVLWVLGEQSYKNIRAKDSSDVIFAGAGKNSNSAEVSLFIDNKDSYFEIECDVLKITRKIHKSGDNDYLINDKKTRLKDISNLFMDTGIGKSAYSVIGQGKVERIISSSNKEIKQIIEEAAGIKKIQVKKQESLRNLKNLDEELEKVSLVMKQIGDNKNHIEKQAGKAKEYLGVKSEKELLEKGILTFDFQKKTNQVESLKQQKIETEEEIKGTEQGIRENDENFEKNELERKSLEDGITEVQDKNRGLKETIEVGEREKARITERLESFKREITEKTQSEEKIVKRIQGERNGIEALEKEGVILKDKIAEIASENKKASQEIEEIEKLKRDREIEQEVKKRKLMDLEVEKLKMVNDIENSTRRAKSSEAKLENLKSDLESFTQKVQSLEDNVKNAQIEKEKKEQYVEDIEKRSLFLESKISESSVKMNSWSEKFRDIEYEEKRAQLKYQNIIRLEESNEGLFKGVKEVLNRNIPGVRGIVASLIKIPEGLERAIEAAISGNLQDIVVETAQVAKRGVDVLKEANVGRASFLALDTIKGNKNVKRWEQKDGVLGIASTLIETSPEYRIVVDSLLGTLLVVDNWDCGLRILKNAEHNGNIVTISGELLSSRGRITGGENKNSAIGQLLERKKEKRVLEEQLEKLTSESGKISVELESVKKELDVYENEIFDIDAKEESARKEFKKSQDELEDIKIKLERTQRDLYIVKSEYESEKNYIDEFSKKVGTSQNEKESLEKEIGTLRFEIEKISERVNELSEEIRTKKEIYSDVRINYLNLVNKEEQIRSDCERFQRELLELEKELEQNRTRVEEVKEAEEKAREKIVEIDKDITGKMSLYEKENHEINIMRERVSILSEEERALINEKKVLESKIIIVRDKNIKEVEKLDRLTFDLEKITENLESLTEIQYVEIVAENYDGIRTKFRALDNKLKNFETVNLLAIEEFEILNKKYTHLDEQYTDMDKSKKALAKLIDEITLEIETRFKNAHSEIDKNFNEMCNDILFNSEGKLLLIEGESLDDAGIDIVVKFKNKRQQSLSLFSGGEKSMVAIAFVMAIFMYKPSPFTFLDEIEAALDDKNTKKLINKLKEFTDRSQFILITHNKETMRESDSIFGVTMNKEIGISKIVPVKF